MRTFSSCLLMTIGLAACNGDGGGTDAVEPTSSTAQEVVVNGGFESGFAPWVKTTYTNATGLAVVPPVTFADLQLTVTGGRDFTNLKTSATPQPPSGLVAQAGVPLWPHLGTTSVAINEWGAGNPLGQANHQGANENVNSLKQAFPTTNADLDPADGKVHVRFVLAPELEAAGHAPAQQPYFFVIVRNTTAPRIGDLYTNFNFSNQPGVPWQSQGAGATALLYTDWQLFDIVPTDDKFVIGDTLEVEVLAAGCVPGGHSGTSYIDGFGAHYDSLSIAKTAPSQANVNTNLTYVFRVQNGAPTTVANVVADELLPRNTTFVSVNAPGATCTTPAVGQPGTVACTYASMAPNDTQTFSITAHNNAPAPLGAGTATAGAAGSLDDTGKVWTANAFGGYTVYITAGTGAGQQRTVTTNTPTRLNVFPNWVTNPNATSAYVIINPPGTNVTPSKAPTAATTTTVTDTTSAWTVNQWAGWTVNILSGTGNGQLATITSNTATTLTVSPAFTTAPDLTSRYLINLTGTAGLGTGTATAGGNTTVTQTGANWRPNQWIGWTVTLLSGTGAPQQQTIVSNTTTQLTVGGNFGTNPAAGTKFSINLPIDKVTNGNYGVASPTITRVLGPKRETVLSTGLVLSDLSITKSDGVAAVAGNGALTYKIVVTNNGPSAVVGAIVKDPFPAALATHSWTCTGVGCAAASGNASINETVSLAAGASITYTITATLNIATGKVTNLATVTAPGTVVDNFPANNAASDTDDVGVVNTLTVTKDPSGNGTGDVTSAPTSISCGTGCTTANGLFLQGSTVTLYASADPGSTFLGWGGACASAGTAPTCTITITGDLAVSVVFSACGNGALDAGEGCDDGNTTSGDGCDAACKVENTFACNATAPGLVGDPSCASGACDAVGNGAPGKCEPVGCGDGHLGAGEGCDDGNTVNGDGCNAACKVENTFTCGPGGDTSCASGACDTLGNTAPGKCEAVGCGDGHLAAGEGCDDGNTANGDGCNAACKVENTFTCGPGGDTSCASGACDTLGNTAPGKCEAVGCGDGHLEAGEGCDDGNTTNGDGCNAMCKRETGQACNVTLPGSIGDPSCATGICDTTGGGAGVCEVAGCGDGRLEAGEGCDDGNAASGDGCNAVCKVENTFTCGPGGDTSCASGACDTLGNAAPGKCEPVGCGDGHLGAGEGCDDGNTTSGDGCTATCKVENTVTCGPGGDTACASGACDTVGNGPPGKCEPVGCGDGHLAAGEGCDDGNTTNGDGCNSTCKRETGQTCNVTPPGSIGDPSCATGVCNASGGGPGVCQAPGCGDAHLQAGEGCDDGNTTNGDGCNGACKVEDTFTCGPGGDTSCASGACDTLGNTAPGKCEPIGCGDGHLEAGEGCDDGNATNGDGCNAMCKRETGQACNLTPPGTIGDPSCATGICDTTGGGAGVCEVAGCGDGHLQVGESCDDGNVAAGDGCNAVCKIENSFPCGAAGDLSCASGTCDAIGNGPPGKCEAPGCGDGHLAAGEGCDDGNTTGGDGCNAACKLEIGKPCNILVPGAMGDASCATNLCDTSGGGTGTCEAVGCGDGRLEAGEGCDDGNNVVGDHCDAACKIESGNACNVAAPGATGDASCESNTCNKVGGGAGVCVTPGCGDDHLAAGEGCDDGNLTPGDGCNAACKVENTFGCGPGGDASCASGACDPTGGGAGVCEMVGCGDGHLGITEGCDDGNTVSGDGCDATCLVEDAHPCNQAVSGLMGDQSCESHVCDTTGGLPGVCIGHDSDGDGVSDAFDLDDDNDGILDTDEGNGTVDTDGDGIPDSLDLDSDNDGIPDAIEAGHHLGAGAGSATIACPSGFGANGLCDDLETVPGSGLPDYDGNGTADDVQRDTDGDGIPDFRDTDSDNDGLDDAVEAGHALGDHDGNGTIDCPGGVGTNGLCDALETTPDTGTLDYVVLDTDGDGLPDYRDLDSDDDGISDLIEGNAKCPDADADSVCDRDAGTGSPPDTDGDGKPDYRDLDSDNDGISDLVEGGSGCADADKNAVCDGNDTDHDGIRDSADGAPTTYGDAGVVAPPNTDGRGPANYRDLDSDDDGISDLLEGGSMCADANNDGVCDGDHTYASPPTDTDGDGNPDYTDLDSDGDGLTDVVEGGHGGLDGDHDGVIDDPTDTDGDGIVDVVDSMPTTFGGLTDPKIDPDGDGLENFQDVDSNNDGLADGVGVSGGGCDVGAPTSPLLVVLALGWLAIRRRKLVLAAASVLVGGGVAGAEPAKFPVERFELSTDRLGLFDIEAAEARGDMTLDAGLWLGYANDPLVIYSMATATNGDRTGSLVKNRVGGSLVASLSPRWWLSIGFEMPLILSQSRDTGSSDLAPMGLNSLSSFGTGDLRLIPKLGLVRESEHGIGLAIVPTLVLPTESNGSAYFGDHGLAFSPELVLAKHWTKVRLAAEAGYRARKNEMLVNLVVGDELFARVGLGFQLSEPVELGVTTSWATAAAHPFANFNDNHLESFVGVSYRVLPTTSVFGGGGIGWQNGFGTPDWRMLAGVRFGSPDPSREPAVVPPPVKRVEAVVVPVPVPEPVDGDQDNDGILDSKDKCPTEPEDKDGFEDDDGCPDLDNDKDGVVDASDKCPNEPGPVENGGCPDTDRDGDTVVDRLDNCPDEPGDPKNFGCKKKQLVTITDGALVILQSVYFQLDKAVILPKSFELLDNVAQVLVTHPDLIIQVEGHTDSQGDDGYNKKLSQKRADAVVVYLVKRKVAAERLKAVGFGEDKPIADNATKEGRAQNRRVVFTILSGGDNVKTHEQGADDGTKEK